MRDFLTSLEKRRWEAESVVRETMGSRRVKEGSRQHLALMLVETLDELELLQREFAANTAAMPRVEGFNQLFRDETLKI